jgi:4-oxalocrotonate tautomerase
LTLNLDGESNEEVKMPIVHVNFWEGVGEEKVKTMIRGITKVIVDLGVPEHAVEVLVHEIPKTHWGIGGVPASEKLKDISPPK